MYLYRERVLYGMGTLWSCSPRSFNKHYSPLWFHRTTFLLQLQGVLQLQDKKYTFTGMIKWILLLLKKKE